ncbi:MAG TPA: YlmC/YmxH family sporulation protein [Bacillota bacterium]|nr:YlmC/YmxH family sporulation protein [Bacillota bacterium]
MVLLSELQIKEVIVMENGRRLGHIADLEIDGDSGKIIALIVLVRGRNGGFFSKTDEVLIYWEQIVTIGADVILVENVEKPTLYTDQPHPY